MVYDDDNDLNFEDLFKGVREEETCEFYENVPLFGFSVVGMTFVVLWFLYVRVY